MNPNNYETMDVFQIDPDSAQTEIGSVELPLDANFEEMPKELEINGYVYHIEEFKKFKLLSANDFIGNTGKAATILLIQPVV